MSQPSPPGPPPALTPLESLDPRTIPPFHIHGRLGAGGMGVVYGATDPSGAWLAVKVIRAEYANDPEFRARFAREIGLVRRVRARCIAPVLDSDIEATQPWYATAYVPGPTLGQRVQGEGALSSERARVVAAGMAEAIAAIHAAGVVHRDLKPANVILAPDGPKVLDFGIARAVDETALTQTGALIGSPGWMSPERFRGEFGPEDDVFAWGAMVAYAATGRPPFGKGGAETLMYRVLNEEPDLSGLPEELTGPVSDALAKEAARRPGATELLHRIAALDEELAGADDATIVGTVIRHHWRPPTDPGRPAPGSAEGRSVTPPGGQPAAAGPGAATPTGPVDLSGPPPRQEPPQPAEGHPAGPTAPPPPVREPVGPAAPQPWPGPARAAAPPAGPPAGGRAGRRLALALGGGATAVVLLMGGLVAGAWYYLRGTDLEVDPQPPWAQDGADAGTLSGDVVGAGSSFLGSVIEEWSAEYTRALQPDVRIDYEAIGAGAGVFAFLDGEVDFASAETEPDIERLREAEAARGCPVVRFPVLAGAVAVVVGDPALDGIALDADALAGIYDGEITSFADPALAELNPDLGLPDTPIVPVRHDDAATTAHVFTRFLAEESDAWASDRLGEEADWDPGTVPAAGDEGVIAAVREETGGIGFVNHGAAVGEDLPQAAVVNADDSPVYPSGEATTAATEDAEFTSEGDIDLVAVTGDGYPIVRLNQILAFECGYDDDTGTILRDVWTVALDDEDATTIATDLGYAPLAPDLRDEALERVARINAEDE